MAAYGDPTGASDSHSQKYESGRRRHSTDDQRRQADSRQADEYLRLGQYEAAYDVYDALLKDKGDVARFYYGKALAAYGMNMLPLACTCIINATRFEKNIVDYFTFGAKVLYESRRYAEAARFCQYSLDIDKSPQTNASAYRLRGEVAWSCGQHKVALYSLAKLGNTDPHIQYLKARILWEINCPEQALWASNAPLYILFKYKTEEEEEEKAQEQQRKQQQQDSDSLDDYLHCPDRVVETVKRYENIQEIPRVPVMTDTFQRWASLFMIRGSLYVQDQKDLERGLDSYKCAATILHSVCGATFNGQAGSQYKQAMLAVAEVYYLLNKYEDAIQAYKDVLVDDTDNEMAHYNIALAYEEMANNWNNVDRDNELENALEHINILLHRNKKDDGVKEEESLEQEEKEAKFQDVEEIDCRIFQSSLLYQLQRYDSALNVANNLLEKDDSLFHSSQIDTSCSDNTNNRKNVASSAPEVPFEVYEIKAESLLQKGHGYEAMNVYAQWIQKNSPPKSHNQEYNASHISPDTRKAQKRYEEINFQYPH
jgi:tetratricopeptide (TPR) repeat protein